MSKKLKKILLALVAIAASATAFIAWYRTKKANIDEEDEFSDIFEEEDFDLDDTF